MTVKSWTCEVAMKIKNILNIRRRCWSLRDICETTYWLSLERRPGTAGWGLWAGPTDNGTTHGVVASCPWVVMIGHRRDLKRTK